MIMGISGWLKIALFSAGSELAEMGNTLGRRVHGQWGLLSAPSLLRSI
jgi:hypothetical protein